MNKNRELLVTQVELSFKSNINPNLNATKVSNSTHDIQNNNDANIESFTSSHNKILNKQVVITTALATRKHCLLCTKTKGLRKIKAESIIHAYTKFGKFIKPHAVCCDDH